MKAYQLLPFRFIRLDKDMVFITNEVGEFLFISNEDFEKFISYKLHNNNQTYLDLKSKNILTDSSLTSVINMLSVKYRTKKSFLQNFTSLHMVVSTLRCNSNCIYCQVSHKELCDKGYDMDTNVASKVVDMIFKSPSPDIKIEFQGGEPLLNFDIIKFIIEKSIKINKKINKNLEFVICTNLILITDHILNYLKKYNNVYISTSLDGPDNLHSKNRPLQSGENSYSIFTKNLIKTRQVLGKYKVDALMTTTGLNITYFDEVINEYIRLGFNNIFLRSLNPYGFAQKQRERVGYPIELFIEEYKKALLYIIELNKKGIYFIESFACLLLTKILTPFPTYFVDLQSPAGIGISGAIYDYNGNVYPSDESRMLAAMGDNKFLLGNVMKNSYNEIFNGNYLKSLIKLSCLESLPGCSYCAYNMYCGADPVRNYSEHGDIIHNPIKSNVCKKNKGIISFLLDLIRQDNEEINNIFWSWITRRPLTEIRRCL